MSSEKMLLLCKLYAFPIWKNHFLNNSGNDVSSDLRFTLFEREICGSYRYVRFDLSAVDALSFASICNFRNDGNTVFLDRFSIQCWSFDRKSFSFHHARSSSLDYPFHKLQAFCRKSRNHSCGLPESWNGSVYRVRLCWVYW